jgi:REP element-mobilizing transposase RayT
MPRVARTVFADLPHHITQRGNRREDVLFDDEEEKRVASPFFHLFFMKFKSSGRLRDGICE